MWILVLVSCFQPGVDTSEPDSSTLDSEPPASLCTCDHVCGELICPRCGGCDDADPFVGPWCTEECNGVDDNCDGVVDEGVGTPYYVDADGDGYGKAGSVVLMCESAKGYSLEGGDCDDAEAAISPAATEVPGNGLDDDCDGVIDES